MAAIPARSAGQTIANPMFSGQDPYVTFWKGNYYYTESGNNQIKIRKSATLTGLKSQTPYVAWTSQWVGPDGHANLWAPEIHQVGKAWYIYFSADFDSSGRHHLYALQGGSDPLDPYALANTGNPRGQITESTGNWAIDPDVFYGADGQLYLTWSCTADTVGKMPQSICLARMSDALHMGSDTVQISSPTQSWETRGASINEGPVGFVHDGKTYITYSASASWVPDNYSVGVLIHSGGDLLTAGNWAKHGPILDHHGAAYGPGSVVFVPSPDGTELWNVYHAYDRLDCAAWTCRTIRMQKVEWDLSGLPLLGYAVDPGVKTHAPSGDIGSFTGWGNSPLGPSASGGWNYIDAANLDTAAPDSSNPLWQSFRWNAAPIAYTASATMQAGDGNLGQFGLYPLYRSASDYFEIYLDTQQGVLVSGGAVGGKDLGLRSYPLPATFDPGAAHTLQVVKSATEQFTFSLDGSFVDTRAAAIAFGQLGILASTGGVRFRDVTVTDASYAWGDAYGDAAQGYARNTTGPVPANGYRQGNWDIADGATVQSASFGTSWNTLFQGNPNFLNSAVEADVQMESAGAISTPAAFGLMACYDDRNNQLSYWVNPSLGTLTWNAVILGKSAWYSAPLPAGFNASDVHHMKTTKQGSIFSFFLDGSQISQGSYGLANGTAGIVTQNALVTFRNFVVSAQ
jgi:GH43 family beta-xylosidase